MDIRPRRIDEAAKPHVFARELCKKGAAGTVVCKVAHRRPDGKGGMAVQELFAKGFKLFRAPAREIERLRAAGEFLYERPAQSPRGARDERI